MLTGLGGHSHPAATRHRSAIAESSRGIKSSRCRVVWAFAADRCSSRGPGSRHGGHCPRWVRAAVVDVDRVQAVASREDLDAASNPDASSTSATTGAPATEAPGITPAAEATEAYPQSPEPADRSGGGGPAAGPPPDPDAVLEAFVSAFRLPPQQLRMVLERQPALQRASPELLAERIDAYTRATGLSAYQLLYIIARRPAFLQFTPAVLLERCEALARGLALGFDDVLALLVSQPALLDIPPDTLRALSGRVAGELRLRPRAALQFLAGLPSGELRALLSRPPGVLRERLAALRRVLKDTFGARRATPAAALLLAARCPPLLALPTKAVAASLAALMTIPPTKGAAGKGASSMLDTLLACPHVLTLPPETLRGRFVTLAAAARIDMPAVVSMLLLQPRLLLVDPVRVRQRLEGLTFSLMVPRRSALDMVVRQPQLLLYNTETLGENWAALQGLLGITFDTALSMITRHPNLLCASSTTMAAKLTALEATFSLPHARAVLLVVQWPALLTMSERRYKRVHRMLSSLLPLPAADLARLVCREPYLLLEDSVKLAAKVSDAASLLGLTEVEVGDMVGRSPNFITKDFRYWQTNFDTITSGLGVSLERARAAALRYPALLAAEPAELLRSVSCSMVLVRTAAPWRAQLDKAAPDALFKCIQGYNDRTREHLQFLVDSQLQSRQPFMSPIIWDRPSFLQRYPAFAEWQAARAAASTAPNGLPLRRRDPLWAPISARSPGRYAADESGSESDSGSAWVCAAPLASSSEGETSRPARLDGAGSSAYGERLGATGPDSRSAAAAAAAGKDGEAALHPYGEGRRGTEPSEAAAAAAAAEVAGGEDPSPASSPSSSSSTGLGGPGQGLTGVEGGDTAPNPAAPQGSDARPGAAGGGRGGRAGGRSGPGSGVGQRAASRRRQVVRLPSLSSMDETPMGQ